MQLSLLRVLQEKEITRIGESKTRNVKYKSGCCNESASYTICSEGKFRWDLYYRLQWLIYPTVAKERGVRETEELFDFLLLKKSRDFKVPVLHYQLQ